MKRLKWLNIKQVKKCLMFAFFCLCSQVALADIDWPQEITGEKGNVVVYQPQPEKLEGNTLTARAAMALELKGQDPIYGVFWFTSTIETDRSEDTVTYSNLKVLKVGWPDSKEDAEEEFTAFVEAKLIKTNFSSSLSKLTASLATSEYVKNSLENIKNDAPIIIFKDKLSVLLNYDGDPIFKNIENSAYQRAMNTPFAVVKVNDSRYFLTSGDFWYQSKSALGPWTITTTPPKDLVALMPKEEKSDQPKATVAPSIVIATKATELVVSSGKVKWASLVGGQLLYVENTETPWLRELSGGDMYLLLSGRWFKSKTEQGPWTFVRADKLPKSFQDIPPESDIGGLRSSIAGTQEAEQAILDAQIPQTAAIQRSKATLTVDYHGTPDFKNISGTDVAYAINTAAQVLKIKGRYYAVDNGVWFTSESATGEWIVADRIPSDEIALIPPSSPVYNTTYVTIYDSTPDIVYVGYTPGYMWSYSYYGVPIYGTGWYYPPYVGGWYYPRPPTWGMHAGYNPWTGWSYGVSWGGPFFRVGVSWGGGYGGYYRPCCGGWYGGGYRGGYHHTSININGDINIGNTTNIGNRNHINNMNGKKLGNNISDNNIYSRPENKIRNTKQGLSRNDSIQAHTKPNHANNVFADKSGQVVRKEGKNWQSRSNNDWKNIPQQRQNNVPSPTSRPNIPTQSRPQQKPSTRQPTFDHGNMNRDLRARQTGGNHIQNRGGIRR